MVYLDASWALLSDLIQLLLTKINKYKEENKSVGHMRIVLLNTTVPCAKSVTISFKFFIHSYFLCQGPCHWSGPYGIAYGYDLL